MIPAYIKHYSYKEGESHKDLVNDIIHKFKIKSENAKVFSLYCLCQGGFRPSKQYIQNKTGVTKNHILRARQWLVDNGFIGFNKEDNEIQIDWFQLRALASIPENEIPKRKLYSIGNIYLPKKEAEKSKDNDLALMEWISEFYNIPLTFDDDIWNGTEEATADIDEWYQAG